MKENQNQKSIKITNVLAYKIEQIDNEQEKPYYVTMLNLASNQEYIIDISQNRQRDFPKSIKPNSFSQMEVKISSKNKKQILDNYKICSCDQLNLLIRKYAVINFSFEGFFGVNQQLRAFEFDFGKNGKQNLKMVGLNQLGLIVGKVIEQTNEIWSNYESKYCRGLEKKSKQGSGVAFDIHPFLQFEGRCLNTCRFDDKVERKIQQLQGYNHQFSIMVEATQTKPQQQLDKQIIQMVCENIQQFKLNKASKNQVKIDFLSCTRARPSKIFNPHIYSKFSKKQKYQLITVKGIYQYYHYGDQNFHDNGWGCAYRALQTLISWLQIQGHTDPSLQMPSIVQIQQKLDNMDRSRKLKGSNTWIGATEISWIVPTITTNQINCKILHVANGKNILEKCQEFKNHFLTSGCPIMYGGGQYAYSIVGMHYNWKMGECQFLILDPHYTGEDDFSKILQKKGLAWRKPQEMFKVGVFYNFCLPIVK